MRSTALRLGGTNNRRDSKESDGKKQIPIEWFVIIEKTMSRCLKTSQMMLRSRSIELVNRRTFLVRVLSG